MSSAIHHIDIRVKYMLKIVHDILVLLVKCVIKNHNGQVDKSDLGKGLSGILGDKKLHKLKDILFKDRIYKEHFFIDPQTNNQLKPSIKIKSLDISILIKLIDNIIFMSNLSKCCYNCNHKKCSCGKDVKKDTCPDRSNCDLTDCPSCKTSPCNLKKILKFCRVVRSLRNCFAHADEDIYDKLEGGNGGLLDFPLTMSWEELWSLICDVATDCLNAIIVNDPQLIPTESYQDLQMDLRIAFKKEIHYIIPSVENNLQHYYDSILGKEKTQDQIAHIFGLINKLNKGLIYFYI